MDDFIYKVLAGVLMIAVFGYLGVLAWQCDWGMIGVFCFAIAAKGLILPIMEYLEYSKQKRQEALHKMYNLPDVVRDEYGHKWDREFQQVISKAIEEATDNEKLTDLLQCQKVAKEMIKDSKPYRFDRPYYSINQAFCLTGCHLTITDSKGKTITQIV